MFRYQKIKIFTINKPFKLVIPLLKINPKIETLSKRLGFPGGSDGKESACNAGDLGSIPGLGRSSGEGNGYPLQHSCLENCMNGGASSATDHRVTKSWTQWSN